MSIELKKVNNWSGTAFNTAPDSENKIHGDELAKEYGFEGGLVPGVTISAYLIHPVIEVWGRDWLEKGYVNCHITSPLYDHDKFEVVTDFIDDNSLNTSLIRHNGVISANAEVAITKDLPNPPLMRKDKIVEPDFIPPKATKAEWNKLKEEGCKAFRFYWGGKDPLVYLRDVNSLPYLLQPDKGGFSNLSFLLGCSNWILAGNAYMNPWVHLQTTSQNFKSVQYGTNLVAEMEVNKTYEKKGHEFVEVTVNLFDEKDEGCVMSISLIAIYRLRGS